MAVTVRFIADVVNWLSGLDKSEAAVDDNADALADLMKQAVELGTQAGKTADEIASDFSTAFGVPLDRAKRAVDEVTSSTEDLADAGKSAEAAGDDIASGIEGGATKAGGSLTELGSIAKDVLSGDIGSAATGAVDALGSIATAAGIGGAAGSAIVSALSGLVGAMVDELTKFAEMSKQVKEGVINDFVELGDGLDQAAVDRRMKEILGGEDTRRQAMLLKDLLGTDLPTALLVLAGDFDTAGISASEASKAIADAPGNVRIDDWEALKATMDGLNQGLAEGPAIADAQAEALSRVAIASAEASVAAGEATKSVDEFGNTVYQLPDGKVVVVDAETGQAISDITTVQDYELHNKTVAVSADTSAFYRDMYALTTRRFAGVTIPVNYVEKRPGTAQLTG